MYDSSIEESVLLQDAVYDVVLLPTFAQVENWRKRRAQQVTAGLFSQTVSTFAAWITDLWELHGDGRALVDSLQRLVLMQAAFDQVAIGEGTLAIADDSADALTLSPGLVSLACKCVRSAGGVAVFDEAVAEVGQGQLPSGLTAREACLLLGIGRYYQLLSQAGLVELGHAASYLAQRQEEVFPHSIRVLVESAPPLNWATQAFFKTCSRLSVDIRHAPGGDGIQQLGVGLQLRFGFPSGRYAQPGLVADMIASFAGGIAGGSAPATGPLSIVVACKNSLGLYLSLEEALQGRNMRVCVQAQVPFASTDFGRQYLQMARMLHGRVWAPTDLSDAVRPPFSGFSPSDALRIDKELRSNRLAQRDECLSTLRIASDAFSQLEELASDPEADVLAGVFEQIAFTSPGRTDAWRAQQLAALSALRACTSAARRVGADIGSCIHALENAKVSVSYQGVCQDDKPTALVVVTTQVAASRMGPGSCDQLIVCDLTSEDYPVADKDDAAATLFSKLGLESPDPALARARRTFTALQALPVSQFACLRPLNDWDGNPTYPCAALQELIDAYRDDATSDADIDEVFGLPAPLMGSSVQRGEEALFANATSNATSATQPVWGTVQSGWADCCAEDLGARMALPRRAQQGKVVAGFSPSPSQVEAFLECPHKWFVQSRLNVEDLDEGFGALERGSFAHQALQQFYLRFQALGFQKVLPSNLSEAKALMRQVLNELEAQQYEMPPGKGRYVAVNQIEQHEIKACKQQLVDYLDFEAQFLPGFHPAFLEYEFKPEDGIQYAGHPFIGIVDRIDVDDVGNAVIVDYKGSAGKAYQIAEKTDTQPGKVQTRMYAQVVKRALGLNVVGALYVSYGKTHACAGAFDPRALEAAHLPNMKVEACSCAATSPIQPELVEEHAQLSFAGMLDRTEQLVACAIDQMQAGSVAPAPAAPESCSYCPATQCPERNA